jgi:hypothetical protein
MKRLDTESVAYKPVELMKLHVLIPKPLFLILQNRGRLASDIDNWITKLIYDQLILEGVISPILDEVDEPDPDLDEAEPEAFEPEEDVVSLNPEAAERLLRAKTKTRLVYKPKRSVKGGAKV